MESNDDIVVLASFLSHIEADLAKSALEGSQIESFVGGDDAGGMQPGLWMSGVRLLVRREDVERATDVLGLTIPLAPSPRPGPST